MMTSLQAAVQGADLIRNAIPFLRSSDDRQEVEQPGYKVEIANVSPVEYRNRWSRSDGAFLGISLQGDHSTGAKLLAQIQWLARHFDQPAILIGDSLHRLTIQIRENLPEPEALEKATRLADQLITHEIRPLLDACQLRPSVKLSSQYTALPDFARYLDTVEELYASVPAFADALDDCARSFVSRRMVAGGDVPGIAAKLQLLSRTYLLEEIALFCLLVREGHSTMIYPGSLSVFMEASQGRYPEVAALLGGLRCISVRLKRRRSQG